MKLVFVINDIATEKADFTTPRLARRAIDRGHEVAMVSLVNISYEADESITALASVPRSDEYADEAELMGDLQGEGATLSRIPLDDADVLMLRMDPADEVIDRPWAHGSGLLFAQLLANRGVIVLNDPYRLTDASNKTYFQQYPTAMRPRTAITRDPDTIRRFVEDEGGKAVIKPLQGSGGQGVFVISDGAGANLNQMIDATLRDGYAICQEYLPEAANGDLRLVTLNGRPLVVDGTYCCMRRYNESDDARSNVSAGGSIEAMAPNEDALRIARIAEPKLVQDGMYLAGLDIVGDKMMEINVDTPGGIREAEELTGVDFCGAVIEDLERKVGLKAHYRGRFSNREIAMA